jgi:hypothetical protein
MNRILKVLNAFVACLLLLSWSVTFSIEEAGDAAGSAGAARASGAAATDYNIPWYVIATGGGEGNSANYSLNATVGQTATDQGSSASYTVLHGYWQNFVSGCCLGRTGNVDLTGVFPTDVDSSDLGLLVNFLFSPPGTVTLPCVPEADVDALGGPNPVDSSDLGLLVAFLFADPPGSVALPDCP